MVHFVNDQADFMLVVPFKVRALAVYAIFTIEMNSQALSYRTLVAIEPDREIIVLYILPKLILQTRMRSHPVGLDV